MQIPTYELVHTEALRRIVENMRREVASLAARGRDTRRVSTYLQEAERELASR